MRSYRQCILILCVIVLSACGGNSGNGGTETSALPNSSGGGSGSNSGSNSGSGSSGENNQNQNFLIRWLPNPSNESILTYTVTATNTATNTNYSIGVDATGLDSYLQLAADGWLEYPLNSNNQNFFVPGSYQITITASNAAGSGAASSPAFITI